jgi:hypothetical protein
MSILVDTSVWSLAFRRRNEPEDPEVLELRQIISAGEALMLGLVRQELLTGISEPALFERLRERLRVFPDIELRMFHYETAAEFSGLCRRKGIQGSLADFLLCAVAYMEEWSIFTADKDFQHFAQVLPIRLYVP